MKVQIIVGSTRPGRVTPKIAAWAAKEYKDLFGETAEVVDLADYELPFLDEPISPQFNPERKPNPVAQKWLDKLDEADAYVIVTPEYNRAPSGVLKNALDYLDFQFKQKPVALIGHGSTGGAQAIAQLRDIMSGLKAAVLPTVTYFSERAGEVIDESGNLADSVKANPYGPHGALKATLEELKWYGDALAAARAKA
ncbi:MAG TPA: NAD(P)H-dependent oxidoreductase [Candidatus Saccharimonadales bacterium]|nr:NAD(P)H-dependent oxidoreductase [Candidatus Saccharimonadales bacterium]